MTDHAHLDDTPPLPAISSKDWLTLLIDGRSTEDALNTISRILNQPTAGIVPDAVVNAISNWWLRQIGILKVRPT